VSLSATYPMRLLCRLLGVPRSSAYYAAKPMPDESVVRTVLIDLAGDYPTYGYRRLTQMLRREGWPWNAKRVRRLMQELHLGAEAPPRGVRTTNSRHPFPRFPNLVKTLEIRAPNQVWVADITYVKLQRDFVYLAVIMDVFTRLIVGWHLGRWLDQGLTLAALERGLVAATPQIHHSDQGVQYAATAYVSRLQNLGVHVSMAKVGEPRENGYAERLMRTIKEEHVALTEYRDFDDARRHLQTFIDRVYNAKRIHSSLGYLTPQEFAARWRQDQTGATLATTVAEDRAPVGTDPSAATRPSPNGVAGRHADSPNDGPGPSSVGPQSDKSNPTNIKII
jgi:putative transposase